MIVKKNKISKEVNKSSIINSIYQQGRMIEDGNSKDTKDQIHKTFITYKSHKKVKLFFEVRTTKLVRGLVKN